MPRLAVNDSAESPAAPPCVLMASLVDFTGDAMVADTNFMALVRDEPNTCQKALCVFFSNVCTSSTEKLQP